MLSSSQFRKVTEVFHAAQALPAGPERDQFVFEKCGDDQASLDEVRSLLAASEEEEDANREAAQTQDESRTFGPYRTIRVLGRGGMGVVYLGERADGHFEHAVAIKTVNAAFTDELFDSRFRAERQILASLNHPNIAKLLDGGTENGDPYFVMEYVEGDHLDRYCDEHKLSIRDRLHLFLQVCSAVSFAHRNLIVHRDLKPSNILVDRAGNPRLLDFGMAKLLTDGGDSTLGSGAATARYASPEQLLGQSATTASDQFSLGVLLYELLVGQWAFGEVATPLAAMERVVRDTPPLPLADAVTELSGEPRGLTRASLQRTVRGDLSAIVMRTLETEPARRYATVDEFANDLRRYLEGRPVLAQPQTVAYRTRRFLRRRWAVVSLAAALCMAMAVGLVSTIQQRRVAERRFEDLRSLAGYVIKDLDDRIAELPGSTTVRAAMAERSMSYLDSLHAQAASDSRLRLELAEGYLRLGNVWGNLYRANLGKTDQARAAFEKGRSLAQGLVDEQPQSYPARRMLARLDMDRALMESLASTGNRDLHRAERSLADFAKLTESTGTAADHFELGRGLLIFSVLKQQRGGLVSVNAGAGAAYENARNHLEKAVALDASNAEYRMALADLHERVAIASGTSNPGLAIAEHDRALALYAQLPESERNIMPRRHWQARAWLNRAWALGQAQRFEEAFEYLAKAQPVIEQLAIADPANARLQYDLTGLLRTWGIIANYAGKKRDAIARFAQGVRVYDSMPQLTPPLRFLRAELIMRTAMLHSDLGEREAAHARAIEAIEALRPIADLPNAIPSHLQTMARLLSGEVVASVKRPEEAVRYARKAADAAPKDLMSQETLASCYYLAGKRAEAIAALQKALALAPQPVPGQPVSRSRAGLLDKLAQYRAGR